LIFALRELKRKSLRALEFFNFVAGASGGKFIEANGTVSLKDLLTAKVSSNFGADFADEGE
jgi:hypothetical protein